MFSEPTTTNRCAHCQGPLIEISISLQPSGPMSMRSCSTCDTRYWHREGEVTTLEGVLDIMAAERVPTPRRQAKAVRAARRVDV
jgi:hypothetical protein